MEANRGTYYTMLKKSTIQEIESAEWRQRETYVTRGAIMHCTLGTHEDVLNQPEANGVYINRHPIMTVNDCKVSTSVKHPGSYLEPEGVFEVPGPVADGNIHSFGFCRSFMHPSKPYEAELIKTYGGDDMEKIGREMKREFAFDFDRDTETVDEKRLLYPCVPNLAVASGNPLKSAGKTGRALSEYAEWQNGSKTVRANGTPALTSKSCLNCIYGGKIKLLTNGMDMAPYEMIEHNLKQG